MDRVGFSPTLGSLPSLVLLVIRAHCQWAINFQFWNLEHSHFSSALLFGAVWRERAHGMIYYFYFGFGYEPLEEHTAILPVSEVSHQLASFKDFSQFLAH
ncbi:hypothetical protein C8R45DRAFT_177010 [Mycena sanguinolenta]|nr:hypothetical protein C8R45DRAFT_177010 [Mycena sanguinolenta]